MEISSSLGQIQSSNRIACPLINPTNFKQRNPAYEDFEKKRCRAPIYNVRCSSLDNGLRLPPNPKPLEKEEDNFRKGSPSEETHLKNSNFRCSSLDHELRLRPSPKPLKNSNLSSGICRQIEKLVLCRKYADALEMFEVFVFRSDIDVKSDTYDSLVAACIGLKSATDAERVYEHMVKSGMDMDLYMMNRVLMMCVKCGMLSAARQFFEKMPERDEFSWNTIIGGLVDLGDFINAFRLFLRMWEDNSNVWSGTFTLMIRASAGLGLMSLGQQFHSCALKMRATDDVFVSCSLICMYSRCANIEDARFVFDMLPVKTTVTWNSIIAGYDHHGYSGEALRMCHEMQDSGVKMDHFTYSTIIRVCTKLASLEHGKQAHAGLIRNGFASNIVVNNALIDFYCKWGRIEDAQKVFDGMSKVVVSWSALMYGYGNRGRGAEAVELFNSMVREGIMPNHITFLAVLSACFLGLYDRGREIFESMNRDYKVEPWPEHYACMVELLGRQGLLDEAFTLIRDAPFPPTLIMWASLLTACRVHKNLVLGKYAAQKLYEMDPKKISNYAVLLNIYNGAGNSREAALVRHTLRRKGLQLLPACTWMAVKKKQHVFFTGDKSHPQTKEIYDNLDEIMAKISENGYVPQGENFLADVDQKDQSKLLHHSEKLAISFGLMSTPSSTPLLLVQGHRICDDCHNAIKLISKVYRREIVVRHDSRFHYFKDGSCSCGDYW